MKRAARCSGTCGAVAEVVFHCDGALLWRGFACAWPSVGLEIAQPVPGASDRRYRVVAVELHVVRGAPGLAPRVLCSCVEAAACDSAAQGSAP